MTDPKLRPDQVAAMRAMLVSSVDVRSRTAPAPRVARRIGFAAVAVGAAAAVVAAVAIAVPRSETSGPAAASAMLRDAAEATVDPSVGHGQFLRLATTASYLALSSVDGRVETTIGYLESQRRDLYIPADAAARPVATTTYVAPTEFFGSGAEQFAARASTGTRDGGLVAVPVGQSSDPTRPVEDQAAMPRDPAALLRYLTDYRYQAGSSDENVFAHVVDLLRSGTVKSDLRAALYQAIALMPSVVITERQASLDGRVGTAIGLQNPERDTRQEIIIDQATGEYIGVRLVTIEGFGEIPPGTPLEYTALSATVVDSVPR